MTGMVCPFHSDEWSPGRRNEDGSYTHRCDRLRGHPGHGPWQWLEAPPSPTPPELTGLAEELGLATELPAVLAQLGTGWFEYGLVERAYARQHPADWQRMVAQWGHTAVTPARYTASSYLGGTLARLSTVGALAYHPGRGTGRWSYNTDISWWALPPAPSWEQRTSWADVVGDNTKAAQIADEECKAYCLVP